MTHEKTFILVEIHHKGQLKKQLARDLPGRLAQAAYDLIQARGSDCVNATAKPYESQDQKVFDAIVDTLMEQFSDARVDGVMIGESEACYIAGLVRERLSRIPPDQAKGAA